MSFRARRFSLLFNYFCHGFGVTINALQPVDGADVRVAKRRVAGGDDT